MPPKAPSVPKNLAGCVPIDPSDPNFESSSFLEQAGLIVYRPLNLLICLRCQGAIPPSSLRKHWKNSSLHDADERRKLPEKEIPGFAKKYALFEHHVFPDTLTFQTPIPGIPYFEAYACEVRGCDAVTKSEMVAKRHRGLHGLDHGSPHWQLEKSSVHQVFITNQKMYRIQSVPEALSALPASGSATPNTILDILLREQEERLEALQQVDTAYESTNPFLQKYRWKEEVENLSPETIIALLAFPDPADPLSIIPRQLTLYFEPIVKEMKRTDVHTTTLRWLKSTKGYVASKSSVFSQL